MKKRPTLEESLPLFENLRLFIRVGSSLVIISEFLYLELCPFLESSRELFKRLLLPNGVNALAAFSLVGKVINHWFFKMDDSTTRSSLHTFDCSCT